MTSAPATFRSSDGLELEGFVDHAANPRGAVVVCHPHPRHGGTMNAPLLVALTEALVDDDWSVLRFNFRGVGSSQGESGDGIAELADARGALEFARSEMIDTPPVLVGWSFGAAVAVRAALEGQPLMACVAIAPPVIRRPGTSAGLPPPETARLSAPTLIVCGSNDDQINPRECRRWAESVAGARYLEVPGANHFFWAKYERLAGAIVDFLDACG